MRAWKIETSMSALLCTYIIYSRRRIKRSTILPRFLASNLRDINAFSYTHTYLHMVLGQFKPDKI